MNPTGANATEALPGMAMLGKTALVLMALVGLILLCGWLLRRLGPGQGAASPVLKVIASRAVGPRERVVVLEIEGTWLLLGVGGGRVSKLHLLPAPPASAGTTAENGEDSFAGRFARALGQNLSGRGDSL
ncbi:flagellar biosynthetic protein FliO [Microbulbifer magnicolonia]|uniref:flagellar biosynthetic protein FliO n=1 Tax=Microbulbifer magnicolonia TaxID=3109744 RepID=UPI002B405726|nr:flagellar biosynthetic protein FliO [Microbulbifer sp. GG15]